MRPIRSTRRTDTCAYPPPPTREGSGGSGTVPDAGQWRNAFPAGREAFHNGTCQPEGAGHAIFRTERMLNPRPHTAYGSQVPPA
jgi:hypothetical protein